MSFALTDLPRNLRANPAVDQLVNDLSRARSRNRELGATAKLAVSPVRTTLSVQGGAALAGAAQALGGERYGNVAQWFIAAALAGGGLFWESPEAVLAANGAIAPFTAAKTFTLLTQARSNLQQQQPAPAGA